MIKPEQVGSPMELYDNPASPFVAGLIGSPKMNLFEGNIAAEKGCEVYGIRPEHIRLTENGEWRGRVRLLERLGAVCHQPIGFPPCIPGRKSRDKPADTKDTATSAAAGPRSCRTPERLALRCPQLVTDA